MVIKPMLKENKVSQEGDKELLNQLKLSNPRKELKKKIQDQLLSKLKLTQKHKKRKIRSKLRKKPSKIRNLRIMMKKKWLNTMSLLQTLSNSMEILLPNNLDKLQLKEKVLKEKELKKKSFPKKEAKQEKFYPQNLLLQKYQRVKEF